MKRAKKSQAGMASFKCFILSSRLLSHKQFTLHKLAGKLAITQTVKIWRPAFGTQKQTTVVIRTTRASFQLASVTWPSPLYIRGNTCYSPLARDAGADYILMRMKREIRHWYALVMSIGSWISRPEEFLCRWNDCARRGESYWFFLDFSQPGILMGHTTDVFPNRLSKILKRYNRNVLYLVLILSSHSEM